MFAWIRVNIDYDYCDGLDFIKSFATEKEAVDELNLIKLKWRESWDSYYNYVGKFIDSIKIPEYTNRENWLIFLRDYSFLDINSIYPDNFKNKLKYYLHQHIKYNIKELEVKNYNPPPVIIDSMNDVFILEIPELIKE